MEERQKKGEERRKKRRKKRKEKGERKIDWIERRIDLLVFLFKKMNVMYMYVYPSFFLMYKKYLKKGERERENK